MCGLKTRQSIIAPLACETSWTVLVKILYISFGNIKIYVINDIYYQKMPCIEYVKEIFTLFVFIILTVDQPETQNYNFLVFVSKNILLFYES